MAASTWITSLYCGGICIGLYLLQQRRAAAAGGGGRGQGRGSGRADHRLPASHTITPSPNSAHTQHTDTARELAHVKSSTIWMVTLGLR